MQCYAGHLLMVERLRIENLYEAVDEQSELVVLRMCVLDIHACCEGVRSLCVQWSECCTVPTRYCATH